MLLVLTAVPYGSAEAWWQAAFQCLTFVLAAFTIVERLLLKRETEFNGRLYAPVIALILYVLLQSLAIPGINNGLAISADPFQSRQFAVHLFALLLLGWLVTTHANSRARILLLIDCLILIGVASAAFGLIRQLSQHGPGFLLPDLTPGYGYAQFINSNHFAFLMEMALGPALGLAICNGVRGRRLLLYLAAAVPMWLALVLSSSRGGILSMLCQAVLLSSLAFERMQSHKNVSSGRRLVMRGALIVVLLGGAIVTVAFVGGDPLAGRLQQVEVEFSSATANSYTLRQSIWRATGNLIKAHPVAGVGFGGYWMAITRYHHGSGEATPQQAHNDYLELMASGGLIAVAIVLWFLFALIGETRRRFKASDSFDRAVRFGALAGIIPVAVHSLVDFGLHITINAAMFTALLALMTYKGSDCGSRN